MIETERALRIDVENRLQECLVDPYNNSEINDELRDRLPRAKKDNPLLSNEENKRDKFTGDSRTITDAMESQQALQTDR